MVYTCNPHFKKTQNNQIRWHMSLNANTQEVEGLVNQFDYLNSISCSQKGTGESQLWRVVLCYGCALCCSAYYKKSTSSDSQNHDAVALYASAPIVRGFPEAQTAASLVYAGH